MMRVLLVNKFLMPIGGAEKVALGERELLLERGVEAELFGQAHPQNPWHRFAHLFPGWQDISSVRGARKASVALSFLYRPSVRRLFARVLDEFKPDIVHFHNIYHQLTPSILWEVKSRGIPAAMTLHDYKVVCPNYLLYDGSAFCYDCAGGRFYNAVRKRCVRNSRVASAVCAVELYFHRLVRIYERAVDVFICPSGFQAEKVRAMGLRAKRIETLYNFTPLPDDLPEPSDGGYGIFCGRLVEQKGLDFLLKALAGLGNPDFVIAGDGPLRAELEEMGRSLGLSRTRFVGFLFGDEYWKALAAARFVVLSTKYPEPGPLAVIESLWMGKPVLATRAGGIAEMVLDGETGFLFEFGDVETLAERMKTLYDDPRLAHKMGERAREDARARFSPHAHIEGLLRIYSSILPSA